MRSLWPAARPAEDHPVADSGLKTVDRALDLLELLAHEAQGLRPVEIGARMSLNKVAVHRLLSTLIRRGFVEKREDGRCLVGLKLVAISSLRLNNLELKTEAQPWLRRLVDKVGQPVHLAIRDGNEIVYIEKIETVHSIRMYSQIGKRSPLHCTALGKVLLGALDDRQVMALLQAAPLIAYTEKTTTDPARLLDEIRQVRQNGVAFDREEHEPGVFCAACPILDYRGQIIAALSTAGSRNDYFDQPESDVLAAIRETAMVISRRMGCDPERFEKK